MRSLHIFSLCSVLFFFFPIPTDCTIRYTIVLGFLYTVLWLQTQIELLETSILTFNKSYLSVNCKLKYAMFNIRIGFHDLRVLEVLFTVLSCFWMCEVDSLVLAEWVILHENKEPYSCLLKKVYCRWLRKQIREEWLGSSNFAWAGKAQHICIQRFLVLIFNPHRKGRHFLLKGLLWFRCVRFSTHSSHSLCVVAGIVFVSHFSSSRISTIRK